MNFLERQSRTPAPPECRDIVHKVFNRTGQGIIEVQNPLKAVQFRVPTEFDSVVRDRVMRDPQASRENAH
jgi:hypothetical protein